MRMGATTEAVHKRQRIEMDVIEIDHNEVCKSLELNVGDPPTMY
jgi:hypothetical protein